MLILAFEPFQLYSVGFQLSFAACFGLILFSKQFETALASAHIPLAGSVSACLGASIATAPFQAAYFGCLPLYFVAGNLIAVPLFSLVMVLCIAILIIGIPFPGFAAVLAVAPRAVLFVVERCLGFFFRIAVCCVGSSDDSSRKLCSLPCNAVCAFPVCAASVSKKGGTCRILPAAVYRLFGF